MTEKIKPKYYDFIIIGGGISGLYSAYKLQQFYPKINLLILEGFKAKYFGGRIGSDIFYGEDIVRGAGILRKNNDKLVIELCRELGVNMTEFTAKFNYVNSIEVLNNKKIINYLKNEYKKNPIHKTFKKFSKPLLGEKLYNEFVVQIGYSDFEDADIHDTLYNYDFEYNYLEYQGIDIDWNKLMINLLDKVGKKNILFSKMVESIKEHFELTCKDGSKYYSKNVILATTIESVTKLLPKFPIYKEIQGQPFLRVYGKFCKSSISILNKFIKPGVTIVPGPLKKIIPINSVKGVYMIAYTDNSGAIALKPYLKDTKENRDFFCDLLEKSIGIPDDSLKLIAIKDYYWDIGTHYYKPLKLKYKNRNEFIKIAQNPMPNMFVVGEMISKNQGWTQGALQSVESVI